MTNRVGIAAIGLGLLLGLCSQTDVAAQPGPAASQAPGVRQPSFTSAGLKLTVGSVAASADGRAVTISLVLSNEGQTDVLASIIGFIEGVDDAGGSYLGRQVSSFSHCLSNSPRDNAIKDCVKADAISSYTEIDKGNSVVIPVSMFLSSGQPNKGKKLSLSMTLGVVAQEASADADALTPRSRAATRVRLISIGVPLISIIQGEG